MFLYRKGINYCVCLWLIYSIIHTVNAILIASTSLTLKTSRWFIISCCRVEGISYFTRDKSNSLSGSLCRKKDSPQANRAGPVRSPIPVTGRCLTSTSLPSVGVIPLRGPKKEPGGTPSTQRRPEADGNSHLGNKTPLKNLAIHGDVIRSSGRPGPLLAGAYSTSFLYKTAPRVFCGRGTVTRGCSAWKGVPVRPRHRPRTQRVIISLRPGLL